MPKKKESIITGSNMNNSNGVSAAIAENSEGKQGKGSKKEAGYGDPISVPSPNFQWLSLKIIGDAVYCQNKFGAKALQQMIDQQLAGSTAKAGKVRKPKDFDAAYHDAMHISSEGWHGIPSSAFRNAMIDACRTVGIVMTHAKLAVFVEPDGFDESSGEPLTRITKGMPERRDMPARVKNDAVDIRSRPIWAPGWEAIVTIRFDADMIKASDVVNLMVRVGLQVGIGEGRPSSKKSNGLGWGLFRVEAAPITD